MAVIFNENVEQMQYLGGKSRISKYISEKINEISRRQIKNIAIWEKPFTRTLDVNKDNQFKVTERLFVHKDNLKYVDVKNKD